MGDFQEDEPFEKKESPSQPLLLPFGKTDPFVPLQAGPLLAKVKNKLIYLWFDDNKLDFIFPIDFYFWGFHIR